MHPKLLLTGIGVALLVSGCAPPVKKVMAAKFDRNVNYSVQFSSNDFKIGGVVSAEMPYNPANPNLTELLLSKAIRACKCDTLLLPRYEVVRQGSKEPVLRVTGRAATFKEK